MFIKKLTTALLALLLVSTIALPVFAAETNEVHIHRTEESIKENTKNCQVCLDCGKKVFKCPTCTELCSVELDRCTFCGTKRETSATIQKELIKTCRCIFIAVVIILIALIAYTIVRAIALKNGTADEALILFPWAVGIGGIFCLVYEYFTPILTFLKNGTLF